MPINLDYLICDVVSQATLLSIDGACSYNLAKLPNHISLFLFHFFIRNHTHIKKVVNLPFLVLSIVDQEFGGKPHFQKTLLLMVK